MSSIRTVKDINLVKEILPSENALFGMDRMSNKIIIDREMYRQIKKMSREELQAFLL